MVKVWIVMSIEEWSPSDPVQEVIMTTLLPSLSFNPYTPLNHRNALPLVESACNGDIGSSSSPLNDKWKHLLVSLCDNWARPWGHWLLIFFVLGKMKHSEALSIRGVNVENIMILIR